MVKVDEEILPDAVNHKKYNGMFELYKRIYNHLREDFAELSKMQIS